MTTQAVAVVLSGAVPAAHLGAEALSPGWQR